MAGQAAPVIFDVGANEGITTRKFLSSFPSANVHAFEPHPALFAKLADAFPGSQSVVLNNCGLGNACGTLRFNQSSDLGSSSFLDLDCFRLGFGWILDSGFYLVRFGSDFELI